jgi:lysophospholipase L1-like esterase
VIASFWQMANSEKAPEGWRVAWNPDGPLEQSAKYSDLTALRCKMPNSRRVTLQRGVLDGNGALREDTPVLNSNGMAVIPKSPADRPKRYLIASYTMPRDSLGLVWINDGNFQNLNVPTGVELKLFLNGNLLKELSVAKDRVPTLFQQSLGPLKKGDTISVAVGPAKTGTRSGGLLRYTLEEWPDGQSPPPPLNTVRLPIDVERPQFGPDGTSAVYEAKQAAFNETLLARKPELVFVGDSNTSRWGMEMFEEHFSPYRPVNLGIGGDCVQNVAWRLRRTPLEAVPVKVVVFLIGAANLFSKNAPEEIAGGIEKLVKIVQEKAPGAKILLLGIFPMRISVPPHNENVQLLNDKIQALADGKRVFFLDAGPSLVESDGSISPEVMPDGGHVGMPGYIRWMDAMKPTLQSLLPDRPQETKPAQQNPV